MTTANFLTCSACGESTIFRGCAEDRCRHPLIMICGLYYRRRSDGVVAMVRQVPVGVRDDGRTFNVSVSIDGTIVLNEVDDQGDFCFGVDHHETDLEALRSRWERVERGWVSTPEG